MRAAHLLHLNFLVAVRGTTTVDLESDRTRGSFKHHALPSLREQADLQDAWAKERRENIPHILRKYGVDAWLVSQREYAEETVFWSLKRSRQLSSAALNTMLFLANATGADDAYNWSNNHDVWPEVRAVLESEQPRSIVVDTDPNISFSSGLHAGELVAMKGGLGPKWAAGLVSEPLVAVEYIATQVESRAKWYEKLQVNTWAIISEALSEAVITPGKTTTEDVEWWLREKVQQLNHSTWFHPSVTVIDKDNRFVNGSGTQAWAEREPKIINYGDYLHTDFGVTALGLNTDTQHLGYVLYPGETAADVPDGLKAGLKKGNRVQDIIKSNMRIGKTGNEILKESLDQMHHEGIKGQIYSHPIGDWGHAAGPSIGAVNFQDGEPVKGDLPLLPNMYFSVEFFIENFVPEWNATVQFPLEENIRPIGGDNWVWAYGRQERFHVVQTPAEEQLVNDSGDL
ncbi:hypothetical protein GQ53DRAFT_881382 [Thozetella sp. PMI_491]|nr:hypothetical protein GQ53DRAFT_881382 [Thozetella sp. PMI_491]